MNQPPEFSFRLYVAGDTNNCRRAAANLSALCRTRLPARHQIEIVDIGDEPNRALADRVFLVPTLIILAPSPIRRIIGTLNDADAVLENLGLSRLPADAPK